MIIHFITMQIKIELYYTPTCPDCLPAKKIVQEVLKEYKNIEYKEINAKENMELVEKLGITHVPTIFINGEMIFVEKVDEKKLREEIEKRLK